MSEICRATSIKNPGFLQLLTQCIVESGLPLPDKEALDQLENAVRQDRMRYYMMLESDGRVTGVVSLTIGFATTLMASYGIVGDLYVHPGHRGRGTAAALLLAVMDGAHDAGCAHILTHTAQGMEGLFQRAGWDDGPSSLAFNVDLEGPPPSLSMTGSWKLGWD